MRAFGIALAYLASASAALPSPLDGVPLAQHNQHHHQLSKTDARDSSAQPSGGAPRQILALQDVILPAVIVAGIDGIVIAITIAMLAKRPSARRSSSGSSSSSSGSEGHGAPPPVAAARTASGGPASASVDEKAKSPPPPPQTPPPAVLAEMRALRDELRAAVRQLRSESDARLTAQKAPSRAAPAAAAAADFGMPLGRSRRRAHEISALHERLDRLLAALHAAEHADAPVAVREEQTVFELPAGEETQALLACLDEQLQLGGQVIFAPIYPEPPP